MRKRCALLMRSRTLILRATDNHASLPDNSRRISKKSGSPVPPGTTAVARHWVVPVGPARADHFNATGPAYQLAEGPRVRREIYRSDCWVYPGTPSPAGCLTPAPAGTRGSQRRHRVMGLRRSTPHGLNYHATPSVLVSPPADPPRGPEPLDPSPRRGIFWGRPTAAAGPSAPCPRRRPLAAGRLRTEPPLNTTCGPPCTRPWTRTAPPTSGNLNRFSADLPPAAPPLDLGAGELVGPRFCLPPLPRGFYPVADLTPTTKLPMVRFPD